MLVSNVYFRMEIKSDNEIYGLILFQCSSLVESRSSASFSSGVFSDCEWVKEEAVLATYVALSQTLRPTNRRQCGLCRPASDAPRVRNRPISQRCFCAGEM